MTTGAASSELADALRSALAACPEPTDEPVLLLAALPNLQASPAARQLLHRHAVAVIGSPPPPPTPDTGLPTGSPPTPPAGH